MKKIIYIGNFKLPDKNAAAHRVLANAKIFTRLGYLVQLIGVADEKINETRYYNDSIQFHSIAKIKSSLNILENITNLLKIKNIILAEKEVSHIIFYDFPSFNFVFLFFYIRKCKNIKIISDITEWYSVPKEYSLYSFIKFLDIQFRMKFINKYLNDGLILISDNLNKYYSNKKKIIVPPLIDLNDKKWSKFDGNVKTFDEINFVYAGHPGKGKDDLSRIFLFLNSLFHNSTKKYKLFLIGFALEEFNLNFDLPAQNISILGRINHDKVLSVIKRAHFSIFFRENSISNNFGFPTKLVESLACGTPVITNPTSMIDKYLISGANGFLIDYNLENVEKSRFDILNSNHLILSNNSIQTCRNYFDYELYINDFYEFLNC